MDLPCLSCGKPTSNPAHFFQGILVCSSCHLIASRIYERQAKQLQALLVLCKENIRQTIVQKRLHLATNSMVEAEEPSKEEVLKGVLDMLQHEDRSKLDALHTK